MLFIQPLNTSEIFNSITLYVFENHQEKNLHKPKNDDRNVKCDDINSEDIPVIIRESLSGKENNLIGRIPELSMQLNSFQE